LSASLHPGPAPGYRQPLGNLAWVMSLSWRPSRSPRRRLYVGYNDAGLASGMCVAPVAYGVLGVRFASLVRIGSSRNHWQRSAGHATLDTGGWLDLARQGLSPGKRRQASLAALTFQPRWDVRQPLAPNLQHRLLFPRPAQPRQLIPRHGLPSMPSPGIRPDFLSQSNLVTPSYARCLIRAYPVVSQALHE
jgi:hypothetical protein